jgi:tyrosine-protein kinase Etk/Wzc
MQQFIHIKQSDENDLQKLYEVLIRSYKLFIVCILIAVGTAFLVNRYSIPIYKVSSSILVKESKNQSGGNNVNEFLNSNLFGMNQNFQNELWVIKSSPVLEQTIRNLDLNITYFKKEKYRFRDAYQDAPFKVYYEVGHVQPVDVRFELALLSQGYFQLKASSGRTAFYSFERESVMSIKDEWEFVKNGKFGELIETEDLAIIIKPDSLLRSSEKKGQIYGFEFKTIPAQSDQCRNELSFNVVDKLATVIEISLKTESLKKGIDLVNELMNVYSSQNLDRKNHIATVTIDYIEKQLNEISDSLNLTEDHLQKFRSSNQLLNVTEQANGIAQQYMDLQNQLAELVTRKRYYDYVADYLAKNDNFSNMIIPASLGIQDPLLNNLMSELISAQAQRSNLIENNQEKNPLVPKLSIQIENTKKTISDNISAVSKTTSISIDEMSKRIKKIEGEISRLPQTQRLLGNIERKYRLNDAIYNYLLEKRAEAKITKASNLPDDIVIEPAKIVGIDPISPNKKINYLIALVVGMIIPFGFLSLRSALNNKIQSQEDIEKLTKNPILGKILHNKYRSNNVVFEFPASNIAESFRALRTNLDFYVRGEENKVIMLTSSIEGEGKTFIALNLAMSYAQLGKKTILIDFDLRKTAPYFSESEEKREGLSSYLVNKIDLDEIIIKSPHEYLDYIPSGILPPNPAELIALNKTERLLCNLKGIYDIIILDTTPMAQVTDAYLLINYSELKVIVVRQNLTLKTIFTLIMKDLEQKKVDNVCVVLNDNRLFHEQFGYGYGYNKGH